MSVCLAYWVRCPCCDLDGEVNGRKCQDCDGWGILMEELPPKPLQPIEGEQMRLGLNSIEG